MTNQEKETEATGYFVIGVIFVAGALSVLTNWRYGLLGAGIMLAAYGLIYKICSAFESENGDKDDNHQAEG